MSPGAGRLASAVVILAAGLVACGGPSAVALEDLAVEIHHYHGREVVTQGAVVAFGEDDDAFEGGYVIQDPDRNRVQLLPDEVAEPHTGSIVEVTGEFEFDPDRGRLLHVQSIEPAAGG